MGTGTHHRLYRQQHHPRSLVETARPDRVFLGDTAAFEFFQKNAETHFVHEHGNAGIFFLHPNKEGAAALGKFWAEAILKVW